MNLEKAVNFNAEAQRHGVAEDSGATRPNVNNKGTKGREFPQAKTSRVEPLNRLRWERRQGCKRSQGGTWGGLPIPSETSFLCFFVVHSRPLPVRLREDSHFNSTTNGHK